MRRLLLSFGQLAALFVLSLQWAHLERPLELAKPNKEGLFEFELEVRHKLTMSTAKEHDELEIHDFEPDGMVWTERDKNQLRPCLARRSLLAMAAANNNRSWALARWAAQSEETLPDLVQFNGRHLRLSAVNGQIPGPVLVVPQGAQVLLRLKNRLLLESIGVHLHGMTMRDRWYNDGVAPMQQCPVAVRSDFAFRFTAEPPGTHWYHGRFPDGHQSNGFLGALVVLPNSGATAAVSQRDYVALLQDWPLVSTEEMEQQAREGARGGGAHGEFDPLANGGQQKAPPADGVWALLVNQKGWHSREDIVGRPQQLPWSTFRIRRGQRVRFRLIHGGFRHPLVVHVERHWMDVVAVDGTEVESKRLDAIILYPGERYDVLIRGLREPARPLYRMVVGLAEQFLSGHTVSNNGTMLPVYGLANLEYEDATHRFWNDGKVDFSLEKCAKKPCSLFGCVHRSSQQFTTGDGRKFECIYADELVAKGGDRRKEFKGTVEKHVIGIDPVSRTVDGFRFRMPLSTGPFFVPGNVEQGLKSANCSSASTEGVCFYFKRFALGNDVQIAFINKIGSTGDASLPPLQMLFRHSFSIHLHGVKFQTVETGFPSLDGKGDVEINPELDKCRHNGENCEEIGPGKTSGNSSGAAVWRDTVVVPYGGYTIIRFRADNPGWWVAETQQNGVGSAQFAFGIGEESDMPKPPEQFPSDCGTFDPGLGIYTRFALEK